MKEKKPSIFRILVTFVTIYSFLLVATPAQAYLAPISNAQMYALAVQGNVPALRAAVQRGLNIDSLDRNGDTALCYAVRQRNYTAYNTLRAAGANPNPPCMQQIIAQNRDSFLASRRIVPTTANSRQAYAYLGDDDLSFAPSTWIIGGALLAGTALALIFGLSGGGGGDDPESYATTDYNLAGTVGTSRPDLPSFLPYNPILLLAQNGNTIVNGYYPDYNLGGDAQEGWVISNDSSVKLEDGSSALLTDLIDFNTSVLNYTDYIQVAMKAEDGSTVNNGYALDDPMYDVDRNYVISLKNNTAGLVAQSDSFANNYSQINIEAENGTIGMIGSLGSKVTNQLEGQINMSFNGSKDNHSVIGLYADTGSTALNEGTIYGQVVSSDSSAGTMTGMRGQLLNQENPISSRTTVQNNGSIKLEANANDTTLNTSLVGMGSWLEDDFLNGSMYLSRAGSIFLNNQGSIILNASLSGENGAYGNTSALLQGTGGIIGMRADGNTIATNDGLVQINVTSSNSNTIDNSVAGMLSVHGGKLVNNNNIEINGGSNAYGMLAVRGQGNNSEFNGLSSSGNGLLFNNGTITINSDNSYGMFSNIGGTSTNTGTIIFNKNGVAMQNNLGTVVNRAKIVMNNGGIGMKMSQNGTIVNDLYNSDSSMGSIYIDNTLSNDSTTSDEEGSSETSSQESIGIYLEDGTVLNNGTITMVNTKGATGNISYGIKAANGEVTSSNAISISDTDSSYGISVGNGTITNSGTVSLLNTQGNLNSLGYALKLDSGSLSNTAALLIQNRNNSYGIYVGSGDISNSGDIKISNTTGTAAELAYGISSNVGSVANSGAITISNVTDSYGVSANNGDITNSGQISIGSSSGSLLGKGYGLLTGNGNITNEASIILQNLTEAYGLSSTQGNINNNASITISNSTGSGASIAYGINGGVGSINNNAEISISNINEAYGISVANGAVINNADITLSNAQQSQNKTSYGIKAEKGSVINNANINMDVTGDLTQSMSNDTGSFGIWANEANITNSENASIIFSKRGNGMYSASGSNTNYGTIHMQAGGTGMSTDSGNATNQTSGTITIDDTGVGMSSGNGMATNNGQINITGTMSTGMESAQNAVNNGTIFISGYNSIGMSVVAENASITNNKNITINTSHNGLYNYGMYGSTGIYSRMKNFGTIEITGKEYPTTENVAYGMYLDEGEAQNIGTITLNSIFGYGMSLGTGGTLDNYNTISLNYGGIGMSAGGAPSTEKETSAMTNHAGATITTNGQYSYGMQGLGTATAWNDGILNISGENSYGIYTTSGSGTNTGTITMNDASSVGMFSDEADAINKSTGVITIKGANSIGMQTQNGGTTSTSLTGAVNEGTITLEETAASSVGMASVDGSGVVNNKGTINVNSSSSSGMLANGDGGSVDNNGDININGENSYGMQATQGTTTNNKNITINADGSIGMYADGGNIVNSSTGSITIAEGNNSTYAMYVKSGTADNQGSLNLDNDDVVGIFAESGTATNSNTINLTGDNAVAMRGRGDAQLINDAGKSYEVTYDNIADFSTTSGIIISGNNSVGMEAGGDSTAVNSTNGVITVNGPDSKGMTALGVTLGDDKSYGTATNNGIIIVTDASSDAMYADGGSIVNGTTGMIYTNGEYGLNVHSGQGLNSGLIRNDGGNFTAMYAQAGTIDNQGRITLNGDNSKGMVTDGSASASNSLKTSLIEVNGKDSIGMQAITGTVTNAGQINVNATDNSSVAMQANGGTIINSSTGVLSSNAVNGIVMNVVEGSGDNQGTINLTTTGITAMMAQNGTITNSNQISIHGQGATAMGVVNGTAQNNKTITVGSNGSGAYGMAANGNGSVTNSGTIVVDATDAYALYTNGGTIINSSGATITTKGSSAMYVENGAVQNAGNIKNSNNGFHAIHIVTGTGENTGDITLTGNSAVAIYADESENLKTTGTLKLSGNNSIGVYLGSGTLTAGGSIDLGEGGSSYGIQGGSGVVITNTSDISGSGTGTTGIGVTSGNVTHQGGEIKLTGANSVGISVNTGGANNSGSVIVKAANGSVGMKTVSGSLTNLDSGSIEVSGTSSIGMYASGRGTLKNSGTITASGSGTVGMSGSGATITNDVTGTIEARGTNAIGIQVTNGGSGVNNGKIVVQGLYGMSASGGSSVTNANTIRVEAGTAALYATGSGSKAINESSVYLVDGSSWGICSSGATCTNNGNVYGLNPEDASDSGSNDGSNDGTTRAATYSLARMSIASYETIGSNGNYTASEIDGNLAVDGSALLEGNETQYTISNALTAKDISNLKVRGTAWFNQIDVAESDEAVDQDSLNQALEEAGYISADGTQEETSAPTLLMANALSDLSDEAPLDDLKNYDITAKKGDLTEILKNESGIEDQNLLEQIDATYEAGEDGQYYDALKYAQTNEDLANTVKDEFGLALFNNFAKQNLDVIRSVNRQLNSAIFNNTQEKETRLMAGYDFSARKQDADAYTDDYEDEANSVYALMDKKASDSLRYGVGAVLTKYDSKYNDDSASRNEIMVQVLAPLTYSPNKSFKIVSIPRFGVGFGDYTRTVDSGTYDGDTKNYYYGITNEARKVFDLGWMAFEPTLELNVLGMHQDKIDESGALEVEASDSISIEGGLGFYATKLFEFGEAHKLKIRAGGTIYHEFGNPFKAQRARMRDADIYYRLNGYDAGRNRGIVSVRMDYDYKNNFNLYGEFNKYIEDNDAFSVNAGMGYRF